MSVDENASCIDAIEKLHQCNERRLAAAGGTHQAYSLTRLDVDAEIVKDSLSAGVAKRDILKGYSSAVRNQSRRLGMRPQLVCESNVASASAKRAICCVTSTRATARSRVALSTERPSVQTSTTSPAVARFSCQSVMAQARSARVMTTTTRAFVRRSFSK